MSMPSKPLVEALNAQVGHEFAAHQQYVACAVYYDAETLPRLAAFFYQQAVEERGHAMMLMRYLLDRGVGPGIPAVPAPQSAFGDIVEPVALALEQEQRVTGQFNELMRLAREDVDFQSEQFLQWFLKEQVEEEASMSDLLTVVRRAKDSPLLAEEHLAREVRPEAADPSAPPVAGA
jgi:ferritin